jgi:tRNA-specific 2-thiouridylase
MGEHNGYYFYTIGQRSGLKLGGGPWYVVKKGVEENKIYISRENTSERERTKFEAGKFNWINCKPSEGKDYLVKIRHGANFYKCKILFDDESNGSVFLDKPDKGIAPGQFAVFYDDEVCLGGGVILV